MLQYRCDAVRCDVSKVSPLKYGITVSEDCGDSMLAICESMLCFVQ